MTDDGTDDLLACVSSTTILPTNLAQSWAAVEALVARSAEKANPPDHVGRTIAKVLRDPSPPFRTLVGADAMALTTLRRALPDWLFATGLRRLVQTSRLR